MDKYAPRERAKICLTKPQFNIYMRTFDNMTADRPSSGRQWTSRNAANVALVRDSVAESPETSIRRRSSQLHISPRSLRRILKTNLEMFPYKM
ncbi:hypothetical protein GWI33_013493 [Rhynchophorus ferrugineus]|uniref:Uncharacterized protein n=1 Tax=Rhynchophorus ferrugineus TaxID=354439 RepID=A0A834I4J2_RHYFE|nr:hypothetical protein GWI33_013493 [Rhynchophorus ferrugineus]